MQKPTNIQLDITLTVLMIPFMWWLFGSQIDLIPIVTTSNIHQWKLPLYHIDYAIVAIIAIIAYFATATNRIIMLIITTFAWIYLNWMVTNFMLSITTLIKN